MKSSPRHLNVLRAALCRQSVMVGFVVCGLLASISTLRGDAVGDLKEAFKALDKARIDQVKELAEEKRRELSSSGDLQAKAKAAVEKYRNRLGDPGEKDQLKAARAAIEEAKGELSEEGLRRLLQGTEAGGETTASARPGPAPEPGERNVPRALVGTYLKELDPGPQPVITPFPEDDGLLADPGTVFVDTGKNGSSYFDIDNNLVIFTGNVRVDHPDFDISCDRLELHLHPEAQAQTSGLDNSTIEKGIATGKRVEIKKKVSSGEDAQIGRGTKATYYGSSGDIHLEGKPEIQKGRHMQRATASSTKMVLRQNGQPSVRGPSTIILTKAPPKEAAPPTRRRDGRRRTVPATS